MTHPLVGQRVLVTGASGFLGGALARRLLAEGVQVVAVQRRDVPALRALGAEVHRHDLLDGAALTAAARGCAVIFHVAAKAGIWGSGESYHLANVVGTRKVLTACRDAGVPAMVHTSSPSVVFAGRDEVGIDESAPYPTQHLGHYAASKAMAEREVLAAADSTLRTIALRPHLIWGPGDAHLLPRLVAKARAGRLRLVGDGRNRIDSTVIDNAVDAHLAAAAALFGPEDRSGRAYFISNGEPLPIVQLVASLLASQGIAWRPRYVGERIGSVVGAGCEALWAVLRLPGEPPLTRFVARQLATEHFFDLAAAQRDLSWRPRVSIAEGLEALRVDAEARS